MSYPTQRGTLNRLETETRRAGRAHEDLCLTALKYGWDSTKQAMRAAVMSEYHASHGRDAWNLRTAGPTIQRIGAHVMSRLSTFHSVTVTLVRQSIRDGYRHEALRQVWVLDHLTPPSRRPRIPKRALRESESGYTAGWDDALAEWLKAYAATLATNLRLEALHEGDLADAADEVNAVKVGGFDPAYKFSSMMTNQILLAQRQARADVGSANGGASGEDSIGMGDDLVDEEIFQTMEDADVCPDCNSQDGVPVADVEVAGHVYSFNCRCFERIVPRAWAELLRSGDADEKEAALMMDDRGLVPDAMAIRGPDGELTATFTVPFEKWLQGRGAEISGMNLTGVAR